MRLVMMGTGPFAVPTFEALFDTSHQMVGVFTRPPRRLRQRSSPARPSPMIAAAEARGTPVWLPASINSTAGQRDLAALQPDLLVVCDFGEILAPQTLALARLGGINLHGSLLPKYRGAAPVAWAIYQGERETGVTVIQMVAGLDAGPCIAQGRIAIGEDETAAELEVRLARLGAPLVCAAIDQLAVGTARPIAQDPRLATQAPRLKKSDGLVDWLRTAAQIGRQVRAMQPWPTAYTFWHGEGRPPLRIILHAVAACAGAGEAPAGTIVEARRRLLVAAQQGNVELLHVQPAGRGVLSAAEFLCGYPLQVGDRLGG